MKKRIASVVAAVAVFVGILGVGPARADFHTRCTPPQSSATAYAHMQLSGDTLTYTGEVKCVGKAVTIDSLVLSVIDANGRTTTPPATPSCSGCDHPIASGQYTVTGPGEYALYMAFTVQGVPQRYRSQRAVASGPGGALVSICGGNDAPNQLQTCPVPEVTNDVPASQSLVPDLENDH